MTSRRPIQPVIMSGGAGSRLWPLSRAVRPKQFLALASEKTLFQETLTRVAPGPDAAFLAPVVIGGEMHADLTREQAAAIGVDLATVICEPVARNTAAVAAVAAAATKAANASALVLLLPADHHVADRGGFRRAVAGAARAAEGSIVTFGIKPDRPHTGFGYIERGAEVETGIYEVAHFLEKPDRNTAEAYVEGGRHYWNAGIFLYDPDVMLEELALHAGPIARQAAASYKKAELRGDVIVLDRAEFESCASNSIDYAVMERTTRARVAGPMDIGWSDIGSWAAIASGGAISEAASFAIDSKGAVIKTDGPFVGVIGLDDIIVVATGDAVLVAPRARAEEVKKIVEELKARGRKDLL